MITFESTCLLLSSGNCRLLQQSKINMWPDEQIPYLCPAILICSGCLREWFSVYVRVSVHLHYRIYIWIFLRMIRSKISLYLSNLFNKEGHRENVYASNMNKNHSSEKDVVGMFVCFVFLSFFFSFPSSEGLPNQPHFLRWLASASISRLQNIKDFSAKQITEGTPTPDSTCMSSAGVELNFLYMTVIHITVWI